MPKRILDTEARICYNGGMSTPNTCVCGCGGTTKGGKFLPGHDARHKSNLIKEVLADESEAALAELTERGWLIFLEKARNAKAVREGRTPRNGTPRVKTGDGLPMNAVRIDAEMDEDAVAGMIECRNIVIRYNVKGTEVEERIRVGRVKLVAEGEIDFWVQEHTKKGEPILNQLRTVRVDSIVGILNS